MVTAANKSAAVLRWLAPTVVVLSLIPDLAVDVADSAPGVSGRAVTALMLMHLATATVAILSYRRLLPLN